MNNLKAVILIPAIVLAGLLSGCDSGKGGMTAADLDSFSYEVDLENNEEKIGYALGIDIGNNLKRSDLKFSKAALIKALNDLDLENEPLMTDVECRQAIQTEVQKLTQAKNDEAREAGQKYLDENAKKPGVTVTESGLQYEIITEGNGPKPTVTDMVSVHYHGTLTDGTVFDSSVDRGEPSEFRLNGVIRGWTEGLQLMPVGSKWKFTIPSNLAYGPRANGRIPAFSTLVFEVELLEIK